MGLYNFQSRFVPKILAGEKTHTIRAERAHPDKPGNVMHLYTGLRTKKARLLMRRECVRVETIAFTCSSEGPLKGYVWIDGVELSKSECEAFARRDGFENFAEMVEFWDGRFPFPRARLPLEIRGMTADRSLRQAVSELMVDVHLMPIELAIFRVSEMDDLEVASRFELYSGTELSVAKRHQQSGSDFYQVFGSRDSDGTLRRRSTLFPIRRDIDQACQSWKEKTWSDGGIGR